MADGPRQKQPSGKKKPQLPALLTQKAVRLLEALPGGEKSKNDKIPNAALIYGVASAALFVISLYHFFTAAWFNGFLVFVLAAAFLGYALHFIQNPD